MEETKKVKTNAKSDEQKRKEEVEAFINRKLDVLNRVARDGKRSARAEMAMNRVISKNKGGLA
jgi:hypothetical protein